jgi:predicted MPP superfamily phosphohydrolase
MYLGEYFIYLSPLILYAAWRIWTLVGTKLLKPVSAVFFALLVASYPLAERLSHAPGGAGTRKLLIAGYYGLPYLLYLVLTVLGADLLIGLGRLLKIVSREKVRSSRFRRARLAVTLIVPAVVLVGGIINFKTIRIKEYAIDVPRRSSPLTELNIAFASDFHLGQLTAPDFMDEFVAKVNGLKPDIILIGGDVLEGHGGEERLAEFKAGFKRLEARFGAYGVPGNHEGFGGNRDTFFAEAGIKLLREAVVKIDEAFYLVGRADGRARGRKPIEQFLEGMPDDLPIILMDHRPSDIANVSRTRVDVQLSGHTHNGQLFPVNFVTKRQYLLSWGHLKKGRTNFFVSSGIQTWGPPVRTSGRSEILFIRIRFSE